MWGEAAGPYHVHAAWRSSEPIRDGTLEAIGSGLQPDDETFCFWVDEKDPHCVIASWDLRATSIEEAARLCKAAVEHLPRSSGFEPDLIEIGVSTDEGYWVSTDPEADIPA
ncbi:hypothetical protein [Actinopolymorpha alba]|uniref:hypothetical protein n=1 Tax=Actinopolymorpha alba TaxID=533267 RepID=UPI00036F8BC8|nr:hypothetical protein [Actinopolymorpha alba]